jgi:hypothetical protein
MMDIVSVSDLDKLVSTAENISASIHELNTKIFKINIVLWIPGLFAYVSYYAILSLLDYKDYLIQQIPYSFYNLTFSFFVILGIGSIVNNYLIYKKSQEYKKRADDDLRLLSRLLDWSEKYMDNLEEEKSNILETSILQMRLQRIKHLNPESRKVG